MKSYNFFYNNFFSRPILEPTPSLLSIARTGVRDGLLRAQGFNSITWDRVRGLELPENVKEFLMFSDLDEDLLTRVKDAAQGLDPAVFSFPANLLLTEGRNQRIKFRKSCYV